MEQKAEKMKLYLDAHMNRKFGHIQERKLRREELEKTMQTMNLSETVKKQARSRSFFTKS